MNHLVNILLLSCTVMHMVCGVYRNSQNVANLFFRSHLASQDPATSMECFSDYIARSNEIGETYGHDYRQCLLDANIGRQDTEGQMLNKRIAIEEGSRNVCQRLSSCDGLTTTLEIFHCHAEIGANNTKDVYDISGNASEYSSELQEKYRNLDLRHEQCSKTAERGYVETTGVNYRNLQACLDGRITSSAPTSTTTMILMANTTPEPITNIGNTTTAISSAADKTT